MGPRKTLPNPRDELLADEEYEVEAIIDHRRHRNKLYFLIRWKGYGPEEDSWVEDSGLRNAPALRRAYKSLQGL